MPWLHVVLDVPDHLHETTATFWERALGWPAGETWPDHPELRSFEPADGTAYVHLQRVDGPPRVHLDLEADDVEATITLALDLGAALMARRDRWTTVTSPGGLPLCILGTGDERRLPGPVTWAGGHRSRLVQVCVDSPRSVHDAEVGFWRRLLGERWFGSSSAEFAGKWHDGAGGPLQLLFQRLDEPTGSVRAHLDLGTDDLPADVRRLAGLGAVDEGAGRGWHVLRDPAGLPFCTTLNSPEARERRDLD